MAPFYWPAFCLEIDYGDFCCGPDSSRCKVPIIYPACDFFGSGMINIEGTMKNHALWQKWVLRTRLQTFCRVCAQWMGVWISYEGVCILKMWLQLFQHKFNHYKIPKMALQNDPPCSKLCIQQSVLGHYKMHSHVFNLMWNHGFRATTKCILMFLTWCGTMGSGSCATEGEKQIDNIHCGGLRRGIADCESTKDCAKKINDMMKWFRDLWSMWHLMLGKDAAYVWA